MERAIIARHNAYATAVDTKDRALLDTFIAKGASVDCGILGMFATRAELIEVVMAMVAHVGSTLHFMRNITVRADGDKKVNWATSRCYSQAVVNVPGLDAAVRHAGFYDDRLMRKSGNWRILHQVYTTVA